jgi:hypothetical protein
MFWKSVEVTPFTRYRCNIGPTNTKILVTSYLFNYERIHGCCKWGHILVLQTRVINRINTEKHYNVHIRIVCRPFIEKYFRQFVVDKRPLQLTVFDKRVIWPVKLTYFMVVSYWIFQERCSDKLFFKLMSMIKLYHTHVYVHVLPLEKQS